MVAFKLLKNPTHLYNGTVTHLRMTVVKDRGGASVKMPVSIGTFNCRIQGPPAMEDELHDTGARSFYTALMFCSTDEDIREDDRLQQSENVVWDVSGVDNVHFENVFQQVNLKRSI